MHIHNPPSDKILNDSLEKILQKSFPDSAKERHYLYLVDSVDEIRLLNTTLGRLFPKNAKVLVVAVELRKQQAWLQKQGISVTSDYSDPSDTREDKLVHFYSSEDCRPLISHAFKEVSNSLLRLTTKYQASIAPVGSDQLPDFPCKLDTDILVCVPTKKDYVLFCNELSVSSVFVIPPKNIGERHAFFYAQLLGTPIDLHVYNSTLETNSLYRQTQQLQHDTDLRERYKQLKVENEGSKASEYRKAKAAFCQENGWTM